MSDIAKVYPLHQLLLAKENDEEHTDVYLESFEKIEIPNSRPVNRIYYNSDSNKAFISTNGTNSYVYSLTDKSLTDKSEKTWY